VVDLQATDYMDSSALGMLLVLRERAGGDRAQIRIVNCKPEIRRILDIARFGQLFQIA
jgi:anti-anti-sigma factor